MNCRFCGNELPPNSTYCMRCGNLVVGDAQPQQGYNAQPQQGYNAQPQQVYNAQPQQGYNAQPQQGYNAQPQQGYNAQPQQGYNVQPQYGTPSYNPNGGAPVKKSKTGLIVGIIVAVVLAVVLVVVLLVMHGKEDDGKTSTEKQTEEVSSEKHTVSRTTEEVTTTEEPTTTEEEVKLPDYKSAYSNIIRNYRYNFDQYVWQFGVSYDDGYEKALMESMPIAIVDITGDDIPELLLLQCDSYEHMYANLEIYTVDENGSSKEMLNEAWDFNSGGSTGYIMYKIKGSSDLYTYWWTYDDAFVCNYYHFAVNADGTLSKETLLSYYEGPNWEGDYETIMKYYMGDEEIDEATYISEVEKLNENVTQVVLTNYDSFGDSNYAKAEHIYMTYGEALRTLVVTEPESGDVLPFDGSVNLTFSSGAGGWATNMELYSDGTFSGVYYDSDMGDFGEGYDNGTVYICTFSGKFTNIKKKDNDTYTMKLEYLNSDYEPGKEWIEDSTKYISSSAYGIEGGDEFEFYLPGTLMSNLPDDFKSWFWYMADRKTLFSFGLYNLTDLSGFVGMD